MFCYEIWEVGIYIYIRLFICYIYIFREASIYFSLWYCFKKMLKKLLRWKKFIYDSDLFMFLNFKSRQLLRSFIFLASTSRNRFMAHFLNRFACDFVHLTYPSWMFFNYHLKQHFFYRLSDYYHEVKLLSDSYWQYELFKNTTFLTLPLNAP